MDLNMNDNLHIGIDFDKLKNRLGEIEKLPKKYPPSPARGLTGNLLRKVVAGYAGHRSCDT